MDSPEKVDLVADQISFVNKISILLKATSDDDQPLPGYLYKEVSDISLESIGYCESLVEYLTDRLEKNSYHVKLKVLKLMKYTVDNGHPNFKNGLMRKARGVRAATKYGGPPDPLHGNIPYVMVRKVAEELCEVLFEVDDSQTARERTPPKPSKVMVGIGSSGSGKMEGFGNYPQNQQKSFGDTIIDGITKIAEKLLETESDRQRAVLASLEGTSGHYQPPVIASTEPASAMTPSPEPFTPPVQRAPPKHIPGRAGGGWDDDPDPPQRGSSKKHSDSGGSSDLADRLESVTVEDWRLEEQLVNSMVDNPDQHLLSPSQMSAFHRRCVGLNSERVLDFIITKLSSDQEHVVMKSLLLLETYLRSDLVNLEYLATVSEQSLVSLHSHWTGPPRSKARKIIRILEKLTSHSNILSAGDGVLISTETNTSVDQIKQPGADNSSNLESQHDDFGLDQESLLDTGDGLS